MRRSRNSPFTIHMISVKKVAALPYHSVINFGIWIILCFSMWRLLQAQHVIRSLGNHLSLSSYNTKATTSRTLGFRGSPAKTLLSKARHMSLNGIKSRLRAWDSKVDKLKASLLWRKIKRSWGSRWSFKTRPFRESYRVSAFELRIM
jgi:hypothetical protein